MFPYQSRDYYSVIHIIKCNVFFSKYLVQTTNHHMFDAFFVSINNATGQNKNHIHNNDTGQNKNHIHNNATGQNKNHIHNV